MASSSSTCPRPERGIDRLSEELIEVALDNEARVKACLADADRFKQEGNDFYRASKHDEALVAYRSALGRLPKRPSKETAGNGKKSEEPDEEDPREEVEESTESSPENKEQAEDEDQPEPTELEKQCATARAVLNANIAACYMQMGEHKEAVAACTEALVDDPTYLKALQRRALLNEKLDSWSSLSSAQEDYTTLLTLLSPSSEEHRTARRKLDALKPRVEAAQKRELDEMWGKLKGVGNSILGNFGLSTDNFKFDPNGQGGYSMNFVR